MAVNADDYFYMNVLQMKADKIFLFFLPKLRNLLLALFVKGVFFIKDHCFITNLNRMRKNFFGKIHYKIKSYIFFLLFFISFFTINVNLMAQDTLPADSGKSPAVELIDSNYIDSQHGAEVASTDSSFKSQTDDHSVVSGGHASDDMKRGERIFMGMIPFDRKGESCVSCHNIKHVDTLNWNLLVMDIALKYANKDFAAFEQVVVTPSGKKMSEVHKDFKIESKDLQTVKSYLNNMAHEDYPHEKVNIV